MSQHCTQVFILASPTNCKQSAATDAEHQREGVNTSLSNRCPVTADLKRLQWVDQTTPGLVLRPLLSRKGRYSVNTVIKARFQLLWRTQRMCPRIRSAKCPSRLRGLFQELKFLGCWTSLRQKGRCCSPN